MKPNLPMRVLASKRIEMVFALGTQDNLVHHGSDAARRGQHLGAIIRTVAQRIPRNLPDRSGNLRPRPRPIPVQLQLEDTPLADERSVTDKEEEISIHRNRDIGSSGTSTGDSREREKPRNAAQNTQLQDGRRIPQVRLSKRVQQPAPQKPSLVEASAGTFTVAKMALQACPVANTGIHLDSLSTAENLLQYANAIATAHHQCQVLSKSKLRENPSVVALLTTRDFITKTAIVPAGEIGLVKIRELLILASLQKSNAQHPISPSEKSRRLLLPLQMLMAISPRKSAQHSVAIVRLDLLARTLSLV